MSSVQRCKQLIVKIASRFYCSNKVPKHPVYKEIINENLSQRTKIDRAMIEHLEKLSLVDFANQAGIQRLEEAIQFADQLNVVNVANVKPLISVLEDRSLYMRQDKVTEGDCKKEILANASEIEEEYFVAPPGNIPLAPVADYKLEEL